MNAGNIMKILFLLLALATSYADTKQNCIEIFEHEKARYDSFTKPYDQSEDDEKKCGEKYKHNYETRNLIQYGPVRTSFGCEKLEANLYNERIHTIVFTENRRNGVLRSRKTIKLNSYCKITEIIYETTWQRKDDYEDHQSFVHRKYIINKEFCDGYRYFFRHHPDFFDTFYDEKSLPSKAFKKLVEQSKAQMPPDFFSKNSPGVELLSNFRKDCNFRIDREKYYEREEFLWGYPTLPDTGPSTDIQVRKAEEARAPKKARSKEKEIGPIVDKPR